jgi:hypothetical protein
LTRAGARNASEIILFTFLVLYFSRFAKLSVVADGFDISSSSQRRPSAIDATSVGRVSRGLAKPQAATNSGQIASCSSIPGRRPVRFGRAGTPCGGRLEHRACPSPRAPRRVIRRDRSGLGNWRSRRSRRRPCRRACGSISANRDRRDAQKKPLTTNSGRRRPRASAFFTRRRCRAWRSGRRRALAVP